jgi:N-acetylglutamate synthase/N-acetylornithine aminotransferase
MTTDPFPKEYAVEVDTESGSFRVGGMAKGSGMIEPRMATMLGYLTTDAAVDPAMLAARLTEASRYTFNAITVDGEPSTNDCVFALANGASGVQITRTSTCAVRRLPRRRARARARHRARRRRRDQADRDHGHRRGQRCRRVDGGARDRQLARS